MLLAKTRNRILKINELGNLEMFKQLEMFYCSFILGFVIMLFYWLNVISLSGKTATSLSKRMSEVPIKPSVEVKYTKLLIDGKFVDAASGNVDEFGPKWYFIIP